MVTFSLFARRTSTRIRFMNPHTQTIVNEVQTLFALHGGSEYGGECITQEEHALQCAELARSSGASQALITAALLHDIGHLLHDLPVDAPELGVDDLHEALGARWLENRFIPAVTEPVRLHVAAKRYLCAVDSTYYSRLSEPSRVSLRLQGGPMDSTEVATFEASPFYKDALQLRTYDDTGKIEGLKTQTVASFAEVMAACID